MGLGSLLVLNDESSQIIPIVCFLVELIEMNVS